MPDSTWENLNYSSARILIAGVANFLGYHLAEALLVSEAEVVGVDSLISGSEELVRKLYRYPKFSFFRADINQSLPAAIYQNPISHIVHLANIEVCAPHGTLALNELLTNSFGVKNLLDFSLDQKAVFVFSSSIDIYQGLASTSSLTHYYDGDLTQGQLTYTEAKRYAESLCQEYAQIYNADIRIARLSEVYGPLMRPDRNTFFTQLLLKAMTGQDLMIPAVVGNKYYLTFISDVVYGLTKLIFAPAEKARHGIFYFVNPEPLTLAQIAQTIANVSAAFPQFTTRKLQVFVNPQQGKQPPFRTPHINLKRSRDDLNWQARVNLEEGLRKTLDYFSQHRPRLLNQDHPAPAAAAVSPSPPPAQSPTTEERAYRQMQAQRDKLEKRLASPELPPAPSREQLPPASLGSRLEQTWQNIKKTASAEEKGWLSLKHQEEQERDSSNETDLSEIKGLEEKAPLKIFSPWRLGLILFLLLIISYFFFWPLGRTLIHSYQTFQSIRFLQQARAQGQWEQAAEKITVLPQQLTALQQDWAYWQKFCYLVQPDQRCLAINQSLNGLTFASEGAVYGLQALKEGAEILRLIQSASPVWGGDETLNIEPQLRPRLKRLQSNLAVAEQRLSLADFQLQQIDWSVWPGRWSGKFLQTREKLKNLQQSLAQLQPLLEKLPLLLGIPQKEEYLILLQNSAELRASGGFIGSYATLVFDHGKLTQLKVDDIYNPDGLLQDKEVPPAPYPLSQSLQVDKLGLRDANWWPHFPTSAEKIIDLYQKATGEKVDNVIAFNLWTIQELLARLGPINLPEYQETIDASNLFARAEFHSEVGFKPGSEQKKRFLTLLVQELITRLLNAPQDSLAAALSVFSQDLQQGQLFLYSRNEELQQLWQQLNGAGVWPRLAANEDFIAVIDSNVGGNKANFWIKRQTNYRLDIDRDGNLTGVLTIKWQHQGTSGTWPGGDYLNFLRVYLPLYATFKEAQGFNGEVERYVEFERKVFAGWVKVPVNSEKEITLTYQLPQEIGFGLIGSGEEEKYQNQYQLWVIPQAGIKAEPFRLVVNLPAFLQAEKISQGEIDHNQNLVLWNTVLQGPRHWSLQVKRQ